MVLVRNGARATPPRFSSFNFHKRTIVAVCNQPLPFLSLTLAPSQFPHVPILRNHSRRRQQQQLRPSGTVFYNAIISVVVLDIFYSRLILHDFISIIRAHDIVSVSCTSQLDHIAAHPHSKQPSARPSRSLYFGIFRNPSFLVQNHLPPAAQTPPFLPVGRRLRALRSSTLQSHLLLSILHFSSPPPSLLADSKLQAL